MMEGAGDIADTVEVEAGADNDYVLNDMSTIMETTEVEMEDPDYDATRNTEPKDDNNEHDDNSYNGGVDDDMNAEEQLLDEAGVQLASESDMHSITSLKPRLRPIEVVLRPLSNPEDYEVLSLSFVVERVLEEIRVGDDSWFSVEYSDGRIEQVSFRTVMCFPSLPFMPCANSCSTLIKKSGLAFVAMGYMQRGRRHTEKNGYALLDL